jgi:hypothetical protein
MAVTPDPVGAYNQSFQTADTSRRDYERLEMQRQLQAEAAIQRAREQKASDFKMMMEAIGRRDDLKQRVFENDIRTKQLANDTVTAQANAYRARNPISRSGQGLREFSLSGVPQPAIPGDGTTSSTVPPMGEGSVNASGSSANGAEADLPMTAGVNTNFLIPFTVPPTAASGTVPDLLPGELMLPPQAPTDNTPPATPPSSPGLLPVSTPAFTPTPSALNAGLMPRTVALAPTAVPAMDVPNTAPATSPQAMPQLPAASTTAPAVSAPVPRRNDLMGYMLNRTDPYTDRIDIPRVAQMPEVPMFGQADIAAEGRDQLNKLAEFQAQAQVGATLASRNVANATRELMSGELTPNGVQEAQKYIAQQTLAATQASRADAKAGQQIAQNEEVLKGIVKREGALNRLGSLNTVLPLEERRQIYQEASDPRMAQLAEQKIAVLTEYDAFRQLNGITNASRGYSTAEQVVRAKRELDSPDAIKDRKLVEDSQAYQAAIKARPDMDEKAKAELELEIGKANPAQIRQNRLITRLNDALEADMLRPEKPKDVVKPEDIKVNPATGTTAAAASGIDRSGGRDILSNREKVAQANQAAGNEYWGANTADVAQQVLMDGGRDKNGNIIPPFSVALLKKIAEGQAPVEGTSTGIEGASMGASRVGAPIYGEKYVDTIVKENLSNWTPTQGDPVKWGRQTQPTAQDFLKIAAKQRLDKIRADAANAAVPAAPVMPQQTQAAASSVLQKFALPLPPEFGK